MQTKVAGRKHRPIKVLLTLSLALCALWLGFSWQFCTVSIYAFSPWVMSSVLIVHLRMRPRWLDVALIVLIAAFFATIDFLVFHYPPNIMTCLSLSGLSSFLIIAVRSVWERERKFLLYAWVPAALYMMSAPFIHAMHEWTAKAHPKTLDLYLLSFDSSLRVQLAFSVGQYYARLPWLRLSALLAYVAAAIPMALVYAGRLVRFREGAFPSILAFVIAGPMGFLFYNLFPACGPLYVFGQAFPFHPPSIALLSRLTLEPAAFPGWRNAMPSLHLAWTLQAWWYSKGLSYIERFVAFAFLALTVVATLGTGEHWFVDLVVAFPYALMTQAICSFHVPWKDPVRKAALFLSLGGILAWMVLLRYGTDLFWTSPVVPWAFSAATVALVSLRQAKLDTVANLGTLAAAVHNAPAPSPPGNAGIS